MRLSHLRLIVVIAFTVFALGACGRETELPAPANAIPAPPDVAAPSPGSLKTTSGLSTRVLQAGTGTRRPRATERVRVHYTGWTTDGKMFDSSVARGEPSEFAVNQVIRGWTEGLQMMVEGEKRRFWIPAALAYEGVPDKPQGMLVFDVELIKIL
jgi:FKBP-type peptidyl-prolyl cis-trans isomerase